MKSVLVLLSMLVAVGLGPVANADEFPSRPITIIVPLTAGTTVDVVARIYGEAVSKQLGQPIVILNKPGAGGMLAAQSTATAAPDGYTIQMANSGHVIAGLLIKNLSFDAVGDFAGIAMVGEAPAVVAASPKLNARNLQDFVAMVKAKPGAMNYGSGGVGSATHLAGALFLAKARIDMVHVPYKTATDLLSDLVTGRVEVTFSPTAFVGPLVKDGKLQALAGRRGAADRSISCPDSAVGRRRLPLLHVVRVLGTCQDPPGCIGQTGGSVRRCRRRTGCPGQGPGPGHYIQGQDARRI